LKGQKQRLKKRVVCLAFKKKPKKKNVRVAENGSFAYLDFNHPQVIKKSSLGFLDVKTIFSDLF
jgi:hypothetical protein